MTDAKKKKAPGKKLKVKKEPVKDLTVGKNKDEGVVGGGGGSPSKPRTPANYTCPAC